MKSPRLFRALMAVLLSLICCLPPLGASAGSMQITPLEESDYDTYEYLFPEAGVSIYLPLDVNAELVGDEVGMKAVRLYVPQFPNTTFGFFTIKSDTVRNMSLSGISKDDAFRVLDIISTEPQGLSYTPVDNFLPGVSVLRAVEALEGDSYSEHLIALKDGWVLNMMAQRIDGTDSLTPEEAAWQDELLRRALEEHGTGIWKRQKSYTLPNSSISLMLPQTVDMRLAADEPGMKQFLISPVRSGIQYSALSLLAIYDPGYAGKTVLSLDEQALKENLEATTTSDIPYTAPETIEN